MSIYLTHHSRKCDYLDIIEHTLKMKMKLTILQKILPQCSMSQTNIYKNKKAFRIAHLPTAHVSQSNSSGMC